MSNNIRIVLTLDGKQYEAELGRHERTTERFGQTASRAGTQASVLATGIRALGYSVGGFAAVQLISQISRAGIEFERMHQALNSISSSGDQAQQRFEFIGTTAERLGIDIGTTADGYIRLAAATRGTALEGRKTEAVFAAVAEASAKLSLSAADTEGVLRALTQIASKGTLSAEELRQQLGDRLPGAFRIAAQAMGVTEAQLNSMLQRGEIAADEFLPRFGDAMREAFGTSTSTRIDTTSSSFTRLINEIKLTASGIADYLNPVLAATADALVAANKARRQFYDSRPEGSQDLGDGRYVTPKGYLVDPNSHALRYPAYTGGEIGLQAPYASQVDQTLAGISMQFGGRATNEPSFYGAMPPASMNEDQQKHLDLIREEYELLQLETEEQKALYQITEGRYRDESKQAKDLILARAKLVDQQKVQKKAEQDRAHAAEEEKRQLASLLQTYDPIGTRLSELTQAQIRLHEAAVAGTITWDQYRRALEGVGAAYSDLGAEEKKIERQERALEQAKNDLELARLDAAEQGVGLLKQVAGKNTALQLSLLAAEKAIAVSRILINTEVAASRAEAELGAVAGLAMAARIRSMGQLSIALVLASGAIESAQISGGRKKGGGVDRGKMYEVAEGGRPELLESDGRFYLIPGAGGTVRPSSPAAGGGAITQIVNVKQMPGVEVREEGRRTQGNTTITDLIVQPMVSDVARGGPMSRALEQAYGLRRRGRGG